MYTNDKEMSDREMRIAKRYVIYLPEYGVMVCRKCKYALCPSKRSIGEHFCGAHKSMTKVNKKAISRYASKLLLKEAKDIINPLNDTIEPLPALELSKEFKCNSCPYMSKALPSILTHPEGVRMGLRSADWWSGDGLERIDGCWDICKQRVSGHMAVESHGRTK